MGYFKNLQEKWKFTRDEENEILQLKIAIERFRNPDANKDSRTILTFRQEAKEAQEAEQRLSEIMDSVKRRRTLAVFFC
jgi:hypothetical protein